VKVALDEPAKLERAMARLFPDMTWRDRATLDWVVLPRLRQKLAELSRTTDRPLPFNNGAPGLTNGVAALKGQLNLVSPHVFVDGAGFVSIPDLADRAFRSALLADGAYAEKGRPRFRPIDAAEAAQRDAGAIAGIASFFMVPSMGLSSSRAESAIPELVPVIRYLARARPAAFPGPIDPARADAGRLVYARACATCHGRYEESLTQPRLVSFPNWAGDVGTDRSRVDAFDARLAAAVARTEHGRRHIDAAHTGVIAAPVLAGLWSSAPYLTNGSIPTLRHLLEPDTRPVRFVVGGHRLDFERVGIAGATDASGTWADRTSYRPYSTPVTIDTQKAGFSSRGHEAEVRGLSDEERTQLLEYLKLL
jgi:mono/diheme cytochrome c family protein